MTDIETRLCVIKEVQIDINNIIYKLEKVLYKLL